MIIRIIDSKDQKIWDKYVVNHPACTPYHLFAWKLSIEKAYNHRCFYLLSEENGTPCGVFPLVYIKPPFIKGELVSLPFCDTGSILSSSKEAYIKLLKESIRLLKKLNAKGIDLRSYTPKLPEPTSSVSVSTRTDKVRMILNLPGSSDLLWKGFKSKLRSQIKKAEKNGLSFLIQKNDNLETFYNVFSANMLDLGSPVHSKSWFNQVCFHFKNNITSGAVLYKKKTIGVAFMLRINNRTGIPWASTLRQYNHLSPNMLLYWNLLKNAADTGCNQFDFGRSSINEGTYKFKKQWGARPHTLFWHQITLDTIDTTLPIKANTKRDIAENIWRKLPITLANYVGPKIRRYISL